MRRRPDRPNVRQPLPSQRHVTGDVALLLADEVLRLVQTEVGEAMDLHLMSEDVLIWDLVGGQEGARLHVADCDRAAGGHGLALHLQAVVHVGVQKLPLRFAGRRREGRDLLVPGKLGCGQCRDHLAVHVCGPAHPLAKRHDHTPDVLAVVDNVVVEAVVLVDPFDDQHVPNARLLPRRGGQHNRGVVLSHLVVGVNAEVAFRLLVQQHDLLPEA
mmetsp:Transcript_70278/g.189192  ORF Transcript_70278/g.189192 Transcript_70278/m.189192 type:complete len:215 (+) Transcript_70278:179-823(+)